MGPELLGKDVQDLLAHPAPLGEGGEGEVVGVDLPQTCPQSVAVIGSGLQALILQSSVKSTDYGSYINNPLS